MTVRSWRGITKPRSEQPMTVRQAVAAGSIWALSMFASSFVWQDGAWWVRLPLWLVAGALFGITMYWVDHRLRRRRAPHHLAPSAPAGLSRARRASRARPAAR